MAICAVAVACAPTLTDPSLRRAQVAEELAKLYRDPNPVSIVRIVRNTIDMPSHGEKY